MGSAKAPKPQPIQIPEPPKIDKPPLPIYRQSEAAAQTHALELFKGFQVDPERAGTGEVSTIQKGLFSGELTETGASLRISDLRRRFQSEDQIAIDKKITEESNARAAADRAAAEEKAKAELAATKETTSSDKAVQEAVGEATRRRARGRGFRTTILATRMMESTTGGSLKSTLGS